MTTNAEDGNVPGVQKDTRLNDSTVSFDDMTLRPELLRGVYAYGFERPFDIQQLAIMPIIKGHDVIAEAHSGGGKTAAFAIPVLQIIDPFLEACQALVLAPSSVLAQDIQSFFIAIGDSMDFKCYTCTGRTHLLHHKKALQDSPHVVIGTPGLIHDVLRRDFLKAGSIKIIIIDDADQALLRGFTDQIHDIIQLLPQPTQIVFLSATIPQEVLQLTATIMREPVHIHVKKKGLTLEGIRQFYIAVEQEEWKYDALLNILKNITSFRTVTFCNKRKKVEWLASQLHAHDLSFSAIHADMPADERATIMKHFCSGSTDLLIATELLARGINVQKIPLVINYDLPTDHENYIHRVGRGGLFGRKGIVINFVTPDDTSLLGTIKSFHNTEIDEMIIDDLKPYLIALQV